MKKIIFSMILFIESITVFSQESLVAFQIFNKEKQEVSFEEMAQYLSEYDVVFFGELHNNPIAHWLQFELTSKLFDLRNGELVLGAEMFERDNQLVLDEYLNGFIKEKELIEDGKAWKNYKTDYAPLVNFAKDNKLEFVATNVPRRYASVVSKKGLGELEKLSKVSRKKYMASLPIEVPYENPSYIAMGEMMKEHGMHGKTNNFIEAQALKDATMGESIVFGLKKKNKGKLFLHFNGDYHSKNHEGTTWYVHEFNKKLKIAVISFGLRVEKSTPEENKMNTNDFTILCNKNMTKTF
jgi:uncharacterized iron-regulated protein